MRSVAASLGMASVCGMAAAVLSPWLLGLPSPWEMTVSLGIGIFVALVVMFLSLSGVVVASSQSRRR